MCFNCGCGMSDDPMGKGNAGFDQEGKAITEKTFEEAAKAFGMSKEDAMNNTYEVLKKTLKK